MVTKNVINLAQGINEERIIWSILGSCFLAFVNKDYSLVYLTFDPFISALNNKSVGSTTVRQGPLCEHVR